VLDISDTVVPRSDQLNADDLICGDRTITISGVKRVSDTKQPIVISFDGDGGKPFKPCLSMRRVLIRAWGTDASQYVGRSMTLHLDETVEYGDSVVGGVRISHLSHISQKIVMALTMKRGRKKPYTVKPLAVETTAKPPPADTTPTPDAGLVSAGNAASSDGVAMYSAWLANLEQEQKDSIRHLHAGWSKVAKAADAEKHDDIL
jgi:hypothetical protein